MKLNRQCHTQWPKKQQCEVPQEAEEAAAEEAVATEAEPQPMQLKLQGTEVPNTLISLQVIGKGVGCITNLAGELSFVLIHPAVLGRMCTLQNLPSNEELTNSAKKNIYKSTQYTKCCITKKVLRKYMQLLT